MSSSNLSYGALILPGCLLSLPFRQFFMCFCCSLRCIMLLCWTKGRFCIHGILVIKISWMTRQPKWRCAAELQHPIFAWCCSDVNPFAFQFLHCNKYLFLDYEPLFVVNLTSRLCFLAALGSLLSFLSPLILSVLFPLYHIGIINQDFSTQKIWSKCQQMPCSDV